MRRTPWGLGDLLLPWVLPCHLGPRAFLLLNSVFLSLISLLLKQCCSEIALGEPREPWVLLPSASTMACPQPLPP